MLSDAKSREEHDKTKYSPIEQTMAELRSFLCLDVGKITEKNDNWNKSSILDDHEEGYFPCTLHWLGPSESKFYGE